MDDTTFCMGLNLERSVGLAYAINSAIGIETRYWYEPYRLTGFTVDLMQRYMQGVYQKR